MRKNAKEKKKQPKLLEQKKLRKGGGCDRRIGEKADRKKETGRRMGIETLSRGLTAINRFVQLKKRIL